MFKRGDDDAQARAWLAVAIKCLELGMKFVDYPSLNGVDSVCKFIEELSERSKDIVPLPIPELEPEFKVGDWVKDGNGLHIATVSVVEAGGYMLTWSLNNTRSFYTLQFAKEHLTKLPGRPLTTDDLMQVLSGRKITVECHACECKGVIGQVSAQNAKWPNEKTLSMCFFHENQPFGEGEVHDEANPLAYFEDNKLVFADDVENNIYVVSA